MLTGCVQVARYRHVAERLLLKGCCQKRPAARTLEAVDVLCVHPQQPLPPAQLGQEAVGEARPDTVARPERVGEGVERRRVVVERLDVEELFIAGGKITGRPPPKNTKNRV